jgi:hypothetical protein
VRPPMPESNMPIAFCIESLIKPFHHRGRGGNLIKHFGRG